MIKFVFGLKAWDRDCLRFALGFALGFVLGFVLAVRVQGYLSYRAVARSFLNWCKAHIFLGDRGEGESVSINKYVFYLCIYFSGDVGGGEIER